MLTWINSVPGRRNALRFAALGDNGRWSSEARTVVVGDALMANWADVPHIMATPDGALWVHWLQKAGGTGYAADIALSRSVASCDSGCLARSASISFCCLHTAWWMPMKLAPSFSMASPSRTVVCARSFSASPK